MVPLMSSSKKGTFDLDYSLHASMGKIPADGFGRYRLGACVGKHFLDLGSIVSFLRGD
jgi:hypothetical protein